ncbi:MAG: exosortase H-associated membrane protein [Pseudomonadota bacterium]
MENKYSLFIFIVKVLFLFLFFLAIYYYCSPFLLLFTAKLVDFILNAQFGQFISSVTLINKELEVVTLFSVDANLKGQLAFNLNPLKYSYGLPLFFALSFSQYHFSNSDLLIDKLLKCLLAYLVISLAQVWGITFDIIRHLLFEFNGVYAAHFNFSSMQIMLVSFGSQLGFLLLPSLTPILLWIYLENKAFKKLIDNKPSYYI